MKLSTKIILNRYKSVIFTTNYTHTFRQKGTTVREYRNIFDSGMGFAADWNVYYKITLI